MISKSDDVYPISRKKTFNLISYKDTQAQDKHSGIIQTLVLRGDRSRDTSR